jgi:hypothetical protein
MRQVFLGLSTGTGLKQQHVVDAMRPEEIGGREILGENDPAVVELAGGGANAETAAPGIE